MESPNSNQICLIWTCTTEWVHIQHLEVGLSNFSETPLGMPRITALLWTALYTVVSPNCMGVLTTSSSSVYMEDIVQLLYYSISNGIIKTQLITSRLKNITASTHQKKKKNAGLQARNYAPLDLHNTVSCIRIAERQRLVLGPWF